MVEEVRGLCGLLHAIRPIIQRLERQQGSVGWITSTREGFLSPQHWCLNLLIEIVDGVTVSIKQLDECRKVLQDFTNLFQQYNPRTRENIGNFLKALKFALKMGNRESILSRLERHKGSLQLALIALSLYSLLQQH